MEWEAEDKPALVLLIQQFIPKWDLGWAAPHHSGHWQPWPMATVQGSASHSCMYKPFSISGKPFNISGTPFNISASLTTTSALVTRNKGCFNRRNSLKCKAWAPDSCCAWSCSGHRAVLTSPSHNHCFLLLYVGNNLITTVLTKPPKWCFSCKRGACKDSFLGV